MSRKIVILNGSPRNNGNTSELVRFFTDREADVVVHASPLYYWTVSAQLKTAIDRLFALEEGGENQLRGNGKAGILLMAAEGSAFEDSLLYFNHLMEHLRWQNLGYVLAGGNFAVGDIAGKPSLQEAHDLGASIQ
ncbi:MAG: flavodoxin family protein [Acutalibacteraceae bacterium]